MVEKRLTVLFSVLVGLQEAAQIMPSWNLDKKIERLENQLQIVGYLPISIYRILMAYNRMASKGLRPKSWHRSGDEYHVWAFGIGVNKLNLQPFYYGHSIHEAYLKMQRAVNRSDQLRILKKRLTKQRSVIKRNGKENAS